MMHLILYGQHLLLKHNQDIELELLCAIANDMAMHYDEVANLIDNVEDVKIRIKVTFL